MADDSITGSAKLISQYGIAGALTSMIFAPLVALVTGTGNVIAAILNVPVAMLNGFSEAVSSLIGAFVTGPTQLVFTGIDVGQRALGDFWILAPFLGMGMALVLYYMIQLFLKEEETGDSLPGVPIDIPGFGSDEDGGD